MPPGNVVGVHTMCTGPAATGRYGAALDGRHGLKAQLKAHGTDLTTSAGQSRPGLNPPDREVMRVRIPPRALGLTLQVRFDARLLALAPAPVRTSWV